MISRLATALLCSTPVFAAVGFSEAETHAVGVVPVTRTHGRIPSSLAARGEVERAGIRGRADDHWGRDTIDFRVVGWHSMVCFVSHLAALAL